jgi:SAM-dependent methyltransferase
VFNPSVEEDRGARYRSYVDAIAKYLPPPASVLDVGAAFGTGAKVLADLGYHVEAVEPEDDRANYIGSVQKLRVYNTVFQEFDGGAAPYDGVMFSHCLEHLDSPLPVMKRLWSYVKPGGVMYLEVPDLWNIVDWSDALFLAHKTNFMRQHIESLANESGWTILSFRYVTHFKEEPPSLGFVLRRERDIRAHTKRPNGIHTVVEIQAAYRKSLPFNDCHAAAPLIYEVPFIDHFYHTVRRDLGAFVDKRRSIGAIVFEPHDHVPSPQ